MKELELAWDLESESDWVWEQAWVLAKVSAAPMARLPASETASLED